MRKGIILLFMICLCFPCLKAQEIGITIDTQKSLGNINPYVYGQFIEYMGKCIDGGIYDENPAVSDERGFRKDVLEKAKELAPTMLRFPGGTVVKTFHWEDGVGPKDKRKAKKNLIWGGINPYHFGTCEFIEYCRELKCEPVLVVNISTGTPDEAANWVEYCNGTGDTYYANLRRSHGYPEPFNVKYWALGNEEAAEPDAGRHQDPHQYVKDMWHFIKLMKLTDPTIELIANGESNNLEWTKVALKGLDGAVDYIAYHAYVSTDAGRPYSIFKKIRRSENGLNNYAKLIKETVPDEVKDWKKWYRFPHRTKPVKIALDEWGIWEHQEPPYGTTNTYEWRHGLATACFLNVIQRCAEHIGMANWAQMVNILSPIRTNESTSVRQTVFFPLKEYRARALGESVSADVTSILVDKDLPAIDVSATIDREKKLMTLFIVNISPKELKGRIEILNGQVDKLLDMVVLSSTSIDAKNVLSEPQKNVVLTNHKSVNRKVQELKFQGESITICQFKLK
ncbi:MAG: alpha-L-arabinofuranosidase C-terminal domain-containing protein [Parabacteroides sp.]|nr:alpha-L-arabinofuranosidase C-terminal domain-containing protein [Parabacteroides sp.]